GSATTIPARSADQLDSARGWWVVAAAVTSMFAVFGVGYSFGTFFKPMADDFDAGSGATALVFSITIALSFLLAPVTGKLADRFGPRPVLWLGATSILAGLLATAATPNLYLGYVTYGVGVGLAIACGYVPMVATVGGWFERRRAMAMGMAVAGIGLGTLVGAPLSARLIGATSWRTTFVIYACGCAGLLLLASIPARFGPAAVPSSSPRSIRELFRLRDFRLLYLSSLSVTFGLFVPFVFLAKYADERDLGSVAAASLVGLIGGSSVVGRLGLGGMADRLGPMRLYRFSFVVMALSHPSGSPPVRASPSWRPTPSSWAWATAAHRHLAGRGRQPIRPRQPRWHAGHALHLGGVRQPVRPTDCRSAHRRTRLRHGDPGGCCDQRGGSVGAHSDPLTHRSASSDHTRGGANTTSLRDQVPSVWSHQWEGTP
ncbi:MAG: MFS transporter, partial [Acidimicrobiales bacterium]